MLHFRALSRNFRYLGMVNVGTVHGVRYHTVLVLLVVVYICSGKG